MFSNFFMFLDTCYIYLSFQICIQTIGYWKLFMGPSMWCFSWFISNINQLESLHSISQLSENLHEIEYIRCISVFAYPKLQGVSKWREKSSWKKIDASFTVFVELGLPVKWSRLLFYLESCRWYQNSWIIPIWILVGKAAEITYNCFLNYPLFFFQ